MTIPVGSRRGRHGTRSDPFNPVNRAWSRSATSSSGTVVSGERRSNRYPNMGQVFGVRLLQVRAHGAQCRVRENFTRAIFVAVAAHERIQLGVCGEIGRLVELSWAPNISYSNFSDWTRTLDHNEKLWSPE
jgi:hypothetical protein